MYDDQSANSSLDPTSENIPPQCAALLDTLLDSPPVQALEALDASTQRAAELRQHLEGCELCGDEVESLRRLTAVLAATPRRVAPDRDLWPAIEKRLEEPTGSAERPRRWAATSIPGGWWGLLAATLAVGVLLGYLMARPGGSADSGFSPTDLAATSDTALAPSPSLASGFDEVDRAANTVEGRTASELEALRSLDELSASYALLNKLLLRSLDDPNSRLPKETAQVLRGELETMDAAILQLQEAIRSDPDNRVLHRLLRTNYDRQLQVLRRAQELSYRL